MSKNHVYEVTFQYPETDNTVSIKIMHPEKVHLIDVPDILIEKNMVTEKTIEYITGVDYLGETDMDEEICGALVAFEQAILTPTESVSTTMQFSDLCKRNKLDIPYEYGFYYDNGTITENEITIVIIPSFLEDIEEHMSTFLNGYGLESMKRYNMSYTKAMLSKNRHKVVSVNFIKSDNPAISELRPKKHNESCMNNTNNFDYEFMNYVENHDDVCKEYKLFDCNESNMKMSDKNNSTDKCTKNKLIPVITHLSKLIDITDSSIHIEIDVTKSGCDKDVSVTLRMKDF